MAGVATIAAPSPMTAFRSVSIANAYALIASAFGLIFLIATPPLGTADETAHFERAYEVANGSFTGADGLPSGMQSFIDDAFGKVKSLASVTADDYRRWAAIALDVEATTPWPEPVRAVMRLHSPLCYPHLAVVEAFGAALRLPPLWTFYLGRLAALLVGVFLVRAAVARAPATFRPPLAFLALLPTSVVFFAAFNIESLVVGLGFYFFALVASHSAEPERKLSPADIVQLIAVAFLLGQFKSAYMFLPAFALLLPSTKFAHSGARASILALIILPGVAASLVWAMIVMDFMLGDIVYSTMGGNRVEPAAQLAYVLSDPIRYVGIVLRTAFASDAPDVAWRSFLGLGGWANVSLPAVIYALLSTGLFLVWLSGEKPPKTLGERPAVALQVALVGATVGAILTLVYLQWNGVGDPVITGFQGRYAVAAAPLLLAAAPVRLTLMASPGRREAVAFGVPIIGLIAMTAAIGTRYWA